MGEDMQIQANVAKLPVIRGWSYGLFVNHPARLLCNIVFGDHIITGVNANQFLSPRSAPPRESIITIPST